MSIRSRVVSWGTRQTQAHSSKQDAKQTLRVTERSHAEKNLDFVCYHEGAWSIMEQRLFLFLTRANIGKKICTEPVNWVSKLRHCELQKANPFTGIHSVAFSDRFCTCRKKHKAQRWPSAKGIFFCELQGKDANKTETKVFTFLVLLSNFLLIVLLCAHPSQTVDKLCHQRDNLEPFWSGTF